MNNLPETEQQVVVMAFNALRYLTGAKPPGDHPFTYSCRDIAATFAILAEKYDDQT